MRPQCRCGSRDTRRYLNGHACPDHTPARTAGRADVAPAPEWTLAALQARAGRVDLLGPFALKGASDVTKDRPGGYVSRQRAERIAAGTAPRQERAR